ncbi:hypothetical protein C0J52_14042 [Blattella germanica]|nr:hypothetical protein C0J52_14042 [Blattella germanica]
METIAKTPNILTIRTKKFAIVAGYFQPETAIENIIEDIREALLNLKDEAIIVAGDQLPNGYTKHKDRSPIRIFNCRRLQTKK